MSSKQEIGDLFEEAQKAVISGNTEQVKAVLWPQIKYAVRTSTDLSKEDRRKLMILIPEYLDKQSLKAGEMPEILSIEGLMKRSQSSENGPPIWHLY